MLDTLASGSFVYAQYHLQNTHSNSSSSAHTQHVNNEFSVGQFSVCVCLVILKILYVTHKFCIFLSPPTAHARSPFVSYIQNIHPHIFHLEYVYYYLLTLQTLIHISTATLESNVLYACDGACARIFFRSAFRFVRFGYFTILVTFAG